jgi:hypothetical protein
VGPGAEGGGDYMFVGADLFLQRIQDLCVVPRRLITDVVAFLELGGVAFPPIAAIGSTLS